MFSQIKKIFRCFFSALRSHKALFSTLVFFQIVLALILLSHAFKAQLVIAQDVQLLMQHLQQANLNAQELQQGKPFLQNPATVFQVYRSLQKNVFLFAVQFSAIFFLGQGVLWLGTHRLLNKANGKQTGKQALKYTVVTLFLWGVFLSGGYFFIKSQLAHLDPAQLGQTLRYLFFAFFPFYYLLAVALAHLNMVSWKAFIRQWYRSAILKYYYTIPLFIISLLPAAGALAAVFYTTKIMQYFPLMLLSTFAFMVFLMMGRIFFVASLREENNSEKNSDAKNA